MLKKITFKNYRAFKAKQSLTVKKINFLVGPNSAGKSSIIKLIGLLKQSVIDTGSTVNGDVLKYKGSEVDLENFKSISHNYNSEDISITYDSDTTTQVTLDPNDIEFDGAEMNRVASFSLKVGKNKSSFVYNGIGFDLLPKNNSYISRHLKNIRETRINWVKETLKDIYKNQLGKPSFFKDKENLFKYIENQIDSIVGYNVGRRGFLPLSIENPKYEFIRFPGAMYVDPDFIPIQNSDILEVKKNIFSKKKIKFPFKMFIPPSWVDQKDTLLDESLTAEDQLTFIKNHYKSLKRFLKDSKYDDFISEQIKSYIDYFIFRYPHGDLVDAWEKDEKRPGESIYEFLDKIFIKGMIKTADSTFENIKFHPAIRPKPKSKYSSKDLADTFGIDILQDNTGIINQWNKVIKEMGFNYKVKFNTISKKHDLHEVLLKDIHSGIDLNLEQVGYGFSQFLPLTGWKLNENRDRLHVIEQPELHLHPIAQSSLIEVLLKSYSDKAGKPLFSLNENREYEYVTTALANNGKKSTVKQKLKPLEVPKHSLLDSNKYLIETHSEHVMRGVQIMVAKGLLKSEDVGIYYVGKRKNGNSYIKEHKLKDNGQFVDKWPKGFFDTGFKQAMELMKAK